MNKIEELIEKLCPDGVEMRELGEVCYIENNKRKPVKSSDRVKGETPYYGANNIQDYVKGYTHEGNYVLVAEDGSSNVDNYSIQWTDGKFWANNHIHVLKGKENLNSRYLYFCLKRLNFSPYLNGGKRAKLNKENLIKIEIPIPPLEIQEKIVEMINPMIKLQETLEYEKELRIKQYNYYCDKLLNFEGRDDVEWKELGEVCYIENNKRKPIKSSDRIKGETPYYGANNIQDYVEGYTHDGNYVLVAEDGSSDIDNYSIQWTIGKFWANNHIHVLKGKENLKSRYLYFYLKQFNFSPYLNGGKRSKLNKENLIKIKLPIPPLSEQQKIVEILDKFEELIRLLEREIDLREKQYKYYREKLLKFNTKT